MRHQYICEFCGSSFWNKEGATKCEQDCQKEQTKLWKTKYVITIEDLFVGDSDAGWDNFEAICTVYESPTDIFDTYAMARKSMTQLGSLKSMCKIQKISFNVETKEYKIL